MMDGLQIVFVGLLVGLLLPVAVIDLQEQRIPNLLNLAVAGLGLAYRLMREPGLMTLGTVFVQGVLTLGLFVVTAWVMRWVSRNAIIGWGDLKFLVAVSLWVGLSGSVTVLLVASVLHIAVVLAMMPWQGWRKDRLHPFGPMLAVGALGVVVLRCLRDGAAS